MFLLPPPTWKSLLCICDRNTSFSCSQPWQQCGASLAPLETPKLTQIPSRHITMMLYMGQITFPPWVYICWSSGKEAGFPGEKMVWTGLYESALKTSTVSASNIISRICSPTYLFKVTVMYNVQKCFRLDWHSTVWGFFHTKMPL